MYFSCQIQIWRWKYKFQNFLKKKMYILTCCLHSTPAWRRLQQVRGIQSAKLNMDINMVFVYCHKKIAWLYFHFFNFPKPYTYYRDCAVPYLKRCKKFKFWKLWECPLFEIKEYFFSFFFFFFCNKVYASFTRKRWFLKLLVRTHPYLQPSSDKNVFWLKVFWLILIMKHKIKTSVPK